MTAPATDIKAEVWNISLVENGSEDVSGGRAPAENSSRGIVGRISSIRNGPGINVGILCITGWIACMVDGFY